MIRVSEIASSALGRIVSETWRQDGHGLRHEQQRQCQQNQLRHEQDGENPVTEQPGGRRPIAAIDMGIGRYEGRVKRAFGEDCPEMVRKPERYEKRVRDGARAKDGGQHDVARKSGDAREKGITADGENAPEHAPLLQHAAAAQNAQIVRQVVRSLTFAPCFGGYR